ncbi:hypothetical protein AZI87_02245 [Bdellovibrio bacteriovorus]|uniref:PLD phosphodiesterase domain-containing protein n=1 Tax=Bdellovibrio bacteriovorus TaxID=959 RepID=A0A161PD49_BDEBC|nr:phospholipase D-like domain-containing protein [Bdellovibrio bacteriovorus]KYG68104.1 hypothetical protein AZI87_02245 [Bdellovibrio bacteriovorus]
MTQKKIASDAALVTDSDYLNALLKLLDQAENEINILAYSFAIGSAAGKLNMNTAPYTVAEKIKELKRKKPELRIRLYIEGVRDTSDRNMVTAQFLKRAGVEVVYGKTHAKGFSIDGRYVLFGSTNLTHQSIVKNYETNLLIDNKVVAKEFNRYFEHLWQGGGHGGIELRPPMLADGDFKNVLVDMIHSAKRTLEFSIYFFDHKEIRDAFIEAHRRGVKIKGFAHHHTAFALSYVRRTRRTIERLQEEGIDSLYFAPGSFFTHSKYLIKDKEEVALGTGNWLVEDVEIHPQLYIHLKNKELAQQLSKHLAKQIAKQRDASEETHTKPRLLRSRTRSSESRTAR